MATASVINKGAFMATSQKLNPKLEEVVNDLLALRDTAKTYGVFTHKTQREIIKALTPEELTLVSRAFYQRERTNH